MCRAGRKTLLTHSLRGEDIRSSRASITHATPLENSMNNYYNVVTFVEVITTDLVVQWLSVGLVIERSLVRLPAGALSSQPGQSSLQSLRGR